MPQFASKHFGSYQNLCTFNPEYFNNGGLLGEAISRVSRSFGGLPLEIITKQTI